MRKRLWVAPVVLLLATVMQGFGCTSLPTETEIPVAPNPAETLAPDSPSTPATETTIPVSNPVIVITYSPAFILQAGSGNMLVANVSIENRGYDLFNTSPEYFFVVVSNVKYSYDAAGSDLRTVDIPNGGKINGKLAFKVPSGTASREVGYTMMYSGTKMYNVQWFRRP